MESIFSLLNGFSFPIEPWTCSFFDWIAYLERFQLIWACLLVSEAQHKYRTVSVSLHSSLHVGVSRNRGTTKRLASTKNKIIFDDLGVLHFRNPPYQPKPRDCSSVGSNPKRFNSRTRASLATVMGRITFPRIRSVHAALVVKPKEQLHHYGNPKENTYALWCIMHFIFPDAQL
jgi:hypothetical protein